MADVAVAAVGPSYVLVEMVDGNFVVVVELTEDSFFVVDSSKNGVCQLERSSSC
jgi:hypothetical protein